MKTTNTIPEFEDVKRPHLVRTNASRVSMHPTSAPTETLAAWYALFFDAMPSVRQLHYRKENLNEGVDVSGYLQQNLSGFKLLSVQESDFYDKMPGRENRMDDTYYIEQNDELLLQASRHMSNTYAFVDWNQRMLVLSVHGTLLVAYSIAMSGVRTIVEQIMTGFMTNCLHKAVQAKRIHYITVNEFGGFDLASMPIHEPSDIPMEELYNNDFQPIADKVSEFIKGQDSGLVILHGTQGTGKTSYIRHLINNNECKFVYLPMEIAMQLSKPEMVTFIKENLGNSVLILEDCEQLLMDRKDSTFNTGIANILNMADGILGDSLKLRFICTFNSDIRRIDKALLRKGRLVDMYEFKALTAEKTAALMKRLYGDEAPVDCGSLTIAEIFNYNEDNHGKEEQVKRIGF